MHIPKTIYEFLPDVYNGIAVVSMLLYPSIIVIFCGLFLTLCSVMVWRARKNYRYKLDENYVDDVKDWHLKTTIHNVMDKLK